MNNFKINFKFRKFNINIKRGLLNTILVSFLTVVITLSIASFVVFKNRARIFNLFAGDYIKKQQLVNAILGENNKLNELKETSPSILSDLLPIVKKSEDTIVSAVKKADPAVVSIMISKEVPKYEISYDQNSQLNDIFGNPLSNIFLQTPTYKQNGTENKQTGSGSGFLVSSDGYIVTNRHVVADTTASFTVFLKSGAKYTAKVLARDSVLDIAIIKITPLSGKSFPYLELGDSDNLDVGQSVLAIGNALGEFKNSVSSGVISGLSRSVVANDGVGNSEQLSKVIQTDAAINLGNSGGPLLDLSGKVVGVNVAVIQGSESIGFSLPINSVKSVINSVRKTGKIVRPYLGIRYTNITPELKSKNNLSFDYGIWIQKGKDSTEPAVVAGSPANKAGILEGDIILEVDGQKIDKDKDFAYYVRGKNVGDTITMKISSKGVVRTIYLNLEKAPDSV